MVSISEKSIYERKEALKQSAGDSGQTRLFCTEGNCFKCLEHFHANFFWYCPYCKKRPQACALVLYQPDLANSCRHYKNGFCLHRKYCSGQREWNSNETK